MADGLESFVFPNDQSLCESCGYSLRGMSPNNDATCPECGKSIAYSSPIHRPGLPWQNHISILNWVRTTAALLWRPAAAFRRLRLDGPALNHRLYLFIIIAAVSISWYAAALYLHQPQAYWVLLLVPPILYFLTYVEARGVGFFARMDGWRLNGRSAECVACYSAIGWIPGAALVASALMDGGFHYWYYPLWFVSWGPMPWWSPYVAFILLLTVGTLWFEILVWLGVKRVRFANMQGTPSPLSLGARERAG